MDRSLPRLLGGDVPYINLDYAASTPVMAEVWEAVEAFIPWYSSVHRGSGLKSRVSTQAYEDARGDVARFVGARGPDDVVFVRNTTEAINVLAASLPAASRVLTSPVEHHANMLPWRGRHDIRMLPFTRSAAGLLDAAERALRAEPIDLVAVTGASNVTGEVWPLEELAGLAHRNGAKLFVDAAQLAPHRPIDMAATGIDMLAFSGHKLYAPFGAGALVGRLAAGEPLLRGGGAIRYVSLDDVVWTDAPERYEAGSPNVIGVVALAAACRRLLDAGMDAVAEHERRLTARLCVGLLTVPGLQMLSLWPGAADRVGVATFTVDGWRDGDLADRLSERHGIGVRNGCFCAHPLMARLLDIPETLLARLHAELAAGGDPELPGAVRASLGLGTTEADVDALVGALHEVVVPLRVAA
jgi:selenocysteine lyase/cysteine desulfurase